MIRILNEVVGEQSTVDGLCQTFSWKVNQLAKVLGKDIVESDLLNGIMKFDARWDGNGEYKLTTDRLSKSNIDAYHAVEGALTSV